MAEVGNLTVPIRADLGPLQRDLDRLRAQLGQANNQTRGVTNAMRGMQQQTLSLTAALRPFAAALAGVFSFRAITQMTDAWSTMGWQLQNATGSGEKAAAVMDRLNQIARSTWSPIQQVTEGFIRQRAVMDALGYSTQQQLIHTEALNAAILISGLRGQRAQSVADAWSRAMASGALRGMEFNTVIENSSRLSQLLAEKMGVTVPELRKLAAQGKITSDVMFGITESVEDLRKELEGDATFSGALVLVANSLMKVVGELDNMMGASSSLGSALVFVADNMQRVISYVATATAGWAAWRAGIILVNSGLFTAAGAVAALQVALRRLLVATGVGILIAVIGELVNIIWDARSATDSWSEAWNRMGTFFKEVTYVIRTAFSGLVMGLRGMWAGFIAYFMESTSAALGVFGVLFDVTDQVAKAENDSRQFLTGAAIRFGDATDALKDAYAKLREGIAATDLSGDGNTGYQPPAETDKKAQRELERLKKAYDDIVGSSQAFIAAQEVERQTIGLTDLEAAKLRARFDLLNQARRAGIELTPDEVAAFEALGDAMAEAEHKTRKLQERYDFAKDTFKGFFTDLKTELQNGASIWEAFGTAAANALQKIADKVLEMALNGIFDLIFGAFGFGGGSSLTKFAGGILSGRHVGLYANGTSFAPGGWSVVGERGPELLKLPAGSQVQANHRVSAPGQASFGGAEASGGTQHVAIEVFVKDDGKIGAIARQEAAGIVEVSIRDYDANTLPDSVQRVSDYPRMR